MISNLPTLLGQQDFNAEHSDMLAAARDGRTVDPKAAPMFKPLTQSQMKATQSQMKAQEKRRPQIDYLLWCRWNGRDPESAAARRYYDRDYDREAVGRGPSLPKVTVTEAIDAALADFRRRMRMAERRDPEDPDWYRSWKSDG